MSAPLIQWHIAPTMQPCDRLQKTKLQCRSAVDAAHCMTATAVMWTIAKPIRVCLAASANGRFIDLEANPAGFRPTDAPEPLPVRCNPHIGVIDDGIVLRGQHQNDIFANYHEVFCLFPKFHFNEMRGVKIPLISSLC